MSTSKASKRILRVRSVASIAAFPDCQKSISPTAYHLRNMCVSAYKPPAFRELHDQNKNIYKPYANHCALCDFAPRSRDAGLTFCTTTEHDGGNMQNSQTLGRSNLFMNPGFHRITMALTIAAAFGAWGCGRGSTSSSTPPPAPVISVTVTPNSVTVLRDATKAFTAKIAGTTNNAVTWSVEESSEEHTSELQSHSFISYAVFCL